MSQEEIIRTEYEAIRMFSKGDKKLAYRIIYELSPMLREYIESCGQRKITPAELCQVLQSMTHSWVN